MGLLIQSHFLKGMVSLKKSNNFLDYIPKHSPKITWSQKDEFVVVDMYHKGFFPWIAQRFFKRPKISHITLDKHGSFIWKNINGKNTVNDIAMLVKAEFGNDAEPLYDRLVQYMRILRNNGFIIYIRSDNDGSIK